jgi:two-component system cell cycle response regulator
MFGKVLLINDLSVDLNSLEQKLIDEYYDVVTAINSDDAFYIIENNRPDVILIDLNSAIMNALDFCKMIKSNPETFYLPVIMITAKADEFATISALECGADDIISKPIDNVAMFARINSLLRFKNIAEQWIIRETAMHDKAVLPDHLDAYFGKKCKYSNIMVVGKDEAELLELKQPLQDKKYKVIYTKDLKDALLISDKKDLDLLIVSLSLGEIEALRFCSKVKSNEKTKNTPILIVGKNEDRDIFIKALESGCNDYIVFPFNLHEYLARVYTQLKHNKYQQQLENNYKKSVSLASIDDLTGVSNRRYLSSYLANMFVEMDAKQQKMAILMVDLDKFKQVNDTYGHVVGDEVLVEFSKRLQEGFRSFDLIARYGGDEFIAIVPYIDEEHAVDIARNTLYQIKNSQLVWSLMLLILELVWVLLLMEIFQKLLKKL